MIARVSELIGHVKALSLWDRSAGGWKVIGLMAQTVAAHQQSRSADSILMVVSQVRPSTCATPTQRWLNFRSKT